MEHRLWERDLFYNKNIPFLFNKEIIEYDMKEAGFSLVQEFHLLPDNIIHKLSKLKKEKRTVELGKLELSNKLYKEGKKKAFIHARELFIEANHLDINDIIAIKKDAIITTKKCSIQHFGDYIYFRPKHIYTSYITLPKRLEFYYCDNSLTVKGINEKKVKLHEQYMVEFIKRYFYMMENSESSNTLEFTKDFIDKYKKRQLPVGYYRTFDYESCYHLLNSSITFDDYYEDKKEDLDISYNFNTILIKFIQIPL